MTSGLQADCIAQTILSKLPSPLSSAQLWGTYPYNPIPGLTKFYYLAQLGFWFHQIYVIFSEQRRKDHWQMFSHHIITIALMSTSYISNFTRVGTLIHTLMDFCDILLPVSCPFCVFARFCRIKLKSVSLIPCVSWPRCSDISPFQQPAMPPSSYS